MTDAALAALHFQMRATSAASAEEAAGLSKLTTDLAAFMGSTDSTTASLQTSFKMNWRTSSQLYGPQPPLYKADFRRLRPMH